MIARTMSLAALFIALLAPSPMRAHDGLVRSVPAKDAHLTAAPTALRLTFTRAPNLPMVRITLTGPGDRRVTLGTFRIDSVTTVVADVVGAIEPGAYRVRWQITGADGHPVRGEYRFTVATTSPVVTSEHVGHAVDTTVDTTVAAPHHDPVTMPASAGFGVQSPAYVVIRWVALTALVFLIGVVVFRFGVLDAVRGEIALEDSAASERVERGLALAGGVAASVFLVATAARLMAQSYALHGGAEVLDLTLVRGLLLETTWGRAWIVQMIAVLSALALLAWSSRRARWIGYAIACVVLAVAQAASGHAASAGLAAVGADSLHVVAAAGWIGALAALILVAVPAVLHSGSARRFTVVAQLVNRFSPMALVFAGLLALSGAVGAWLHLGSVSALWSSDYGRVLLWKLGVLSVVAATGAYNWKRVRPTVHESIGTARLRRSAGIELTVAVVVIAITAVLVATPPPVMAPAVAAATSPSP